MEYPTDTPFGGGGRPTVARSRLAEDDPEISRERREEITQARIDYETSEVMKAAEQGGCTCLYPDVWYLRKDGPREDFHPIIEHVGDCPLNETGKPAPNLPRPIPVPIACPGCRGMFIFNLSDFSSTTWRPIQIALESECPDHAGREV